MITKEKTSYRGKPCNVDQLMVFWNGQMIYKKWVYDGKFSRSMIMDSIGQPWSVKDRYEG